MNDNVNIDKKWMQMDRALFPDKELMKDLTNPEFKALTLLVSVLINSKRCTVKEGVISVNYDEKVSIHLYVMETISRKIRETDFNSRWNQHLKVTARSRIDPNRPPLDVCIVSGDEQLPILDSAFAFVMMVESDFIRMPETLTNAIEDLKLSEEELELKRAREREGRHERRLAEKLRLQKELEEQRTLTFDFECHKGRIDNFTWRQLLEEHQRELTPTSPLQNMVFEYRSKLIGGLE